MQNPTDITTKRMANTIDNMRIAPDLSPALVTGILSLGLSGDCDSVCCPSLLLPCPSAVIDSKLNASENGELVNRL